MEQYGILRSWDDSRGFGFIRSDDDDYFVHITSLHNKQPPQLGETLYFAAAQDQHGRLRAQHVRSAKPPATTRYRPQAAAAVRTSTQQPQQPRSVRLSKTLSVLLVACTLPAIGTWQAFAQNAVLWPLLLYVCMSLISGLQYWCDKHNAQIGLWRIPEKHLHAVELLGGWPGALLAQQLLRHKTSKTAYQGIFWLIVLVHQVYWLDQLVLAGQVLQQLLSIV